MVQMDADVPRYLRIQSAYSPSFGPDGSLLYLSDTTGVAQVWRVDSALEWQHQVTFYDESVSYASYSPERQEFAFGMDEGGDERTQIYLACDDGTDVRNLTRRPESKHLWGGWSNSGDRIAFTSNRRDERVFDVYVQGRSEDEAELVYESDGWLSVVDWSPCDSRLLLRESHSNFDQDLYILDVDSGERTRLTPEEEARWGSTDWEEDGVYLVTDHGADTTYLARVQPEEAGSPDDLDPVVLDDGGDWNVDGVNVEDDRVVYSRNVEGYTDLTFASVEDGFRKLGSPDVGDCVVGGTSWSDDGRLAVTLTARDDNADVHSLDYPDAAELTRWTDSATAGIESESFVSPEVVRYTSFDGLEIPALLSIPRHADVEPPYPVVVDVHGGPESQRRPSFSGLRQYLLKEGYALFEPNVRGSTGYGKEYARLDDVRNRMDSVKDLDAALDYLESRGEVDAERAAAYGGSYGGFMVLAALIESPDRWAAGVDVVGIANFVTFLENTGEWRRELREAEYGSLEEDREFLESISPVNNADRIRAPLLVMHGANDPRVPVDEAEQIVEKVEANDVPVEKLVFDDEGHGFSKLENRIEAYTRMVEFLDRYV